MTRWAERFFILLQKELLLEARGRELVVLLACGSIMSAALVGAGVSSAVLDYETTRKLFPMLLWVVFLLSVTSASVRVNEAELEGRGYEGLLLAGATAPQLYLSKLIVSASIFWLDWCLLVALLALALDQNLSSIVLSLVGIGALSSLTLAALIVLLAAITGTSKMRGVLLPLITIPLLFPLFFAGVELTTSALLYGSFEPSSVWVSVLVVSFTTFVLVGINTYGAAISE